LTAVSETGAGHADLGFAETGFFVGHPAEDGCWAGTDLDILLTEYMKEHTLHSSPYFSFIMRRYGFVPRQFSHTDGQSVSSHPTLLMSAFGGMLNVGNQKQNQKWESVGVSKQMTNISIATTIFCLTESLFMCFNLSSVSGKFVCRV
jgi:hypothetical protein